MAAIAVILLEEQAARRALRRERVFRDRANPLEWSTEELWRRYRFTRRGLMALVAALEPEIAHETGRSQALSPLLQVCTTLNFCHWSRAGQHCLHAWGVKGNSFNNGDESYQCDLQETQVTGRNLGCRTHNHFYWHPKGQGQSRPKFKMLQNLSYGYAN